MFWAVVGRWHNMNITCTGRLLHTLAVATGNAWQWVLWLKNRRGSDLWCQPLAEFSQRHTTALRLRYYWTHRRNLICSETCTDRGEARLGARYSSLKRRVVYQRWRRGATIVCREDGWKHRPTPTARTSHYIRKLFIVA